MSPYRQSPRAEPHGYAGPQIEQWRRARHLVERLAAEPWSTPRISHLDRASLVGVSGDGSQLLVVGKKAWHVDAKTLIVHPLDRDTDAVPNHVALDDRGRRAVLVEDERLVLWDLAHNSRRHAAHSCRLAYDTWLAISADGSVVATADDSEHATVRVFDWERGEVTVSLDADCDHGLVLHPSGGQLFCCGSNRVTMLGRGGKALHLDAVRGVAVARDGVTVALTDRDNDRRVQLRKLVGEVQMSSDDTLEIGESVDQYHPVLCFSPSGNHLLVHTERGHESGVTLVDRTHRAGRFLTLEGGAHFHTPQTGMLSCGVVVVGEESGRTHDLRGIRPMAALFRAADGQYLGGLGVAGAREEEARDLVGITADLIHGRLDGAPLQPDGPRLPFERPDLVRLLLLDRPAPWSDQEQALLEDLRLRRQAIVERSSLFPSGTSLDLLVDALRGVTHLVPEIVVRAKRIASAAPRFGKSQIPASVFVAVCEELGGIDRSEQERVFEEMIGRMGSQPALVALSTAPEPVDDEPTPVDPPPAESLLTVPKPATTEADTTDMTEIARPPDRGSSPLFWLIPLLGAALGLAVYFMAR